jgi:hypothetical protein
VALILDSRNFNLSGSATGDFFPLQPSAWMVQISAASFRRAADPRCAAGPKVCDVVAEFLVGHRGGLKNAAAKVGL